MKEEECKLQELINEKYQAFSLEEKKLVHELYLQDDDKNSEACKQLEKIIFRLTPPTPEEFLDPANEWLSKPFVESLYPHVVEDFIGIMNIDNNYTQIVEYGATRLGKCHSKNTLVLMYDLSVKNVQDIKVGDLLMGDDSKPKVVLETHKGYGKLYKIKQNKADDYIVNENHILTLQRTKKSNSKQNSHDYEIKDISVKDYLKLSKTQKHLLKGIKAKLNFPEQEVKIDPYYLGVWLGDGNSNNTGITSEDDEIKNYLYEYSDRLNLKISEYNKKDSKAILYKIIGTKGANQFCKSDNTLFYLLKETYNLLFNKHIPLEYLRNSEKIRLQVLAGIIDTDGYKNKKNSFFEINQTNEKLANQMCFLARSLGFRTRIKKRILDTNFKKGAITYRITIFGNLSLIPTKIKRKQVNENTCRTDPLRTGIKVEEFGEGEFYGFELDGNHRYLLEDLTITHNSFLARLIIMYSIVYIHCLRHPQLYYGLSPTTQLSIYIMCFNVEKVKQLLLKPIYNFLNASPRFKQIKFQDKVSEEQKKNGLDIIYWSRAATFGELTLDSGLTINLGTDFMSFIGSDMLMMIISEIAFFVEKTGATHDQIFQLYTNGLDRIKATVGDNYLGMVYLDTSANDVDNPIEKYILNDLSHRKDVFFRKRSRWEARPHMFPEWEKTGKTFKMFVGNNIYPPKIVETQQDLEELPKQHMIDVPIDVIERFEEAPLNSIKNIAGMPTIRESKLITNYTYISNTFDNKHLRNIEGIIYAESTKEPEGLIWELIKDEFFEQTLEKKSIIYRAPREIRFVGIDLAHSLTGDVQGFTLGHKEWSRELQTVMYIADFSFPIGAKESAINLEAISCLVIDLVLKGRIAIKQVFCDSFQSATMQQFLLRNNIDMIRQSIEKTVNPYQYYLTCLSNNTVKNGKNIFLKNNLDSLLITKDKKDKEKIDHSKGKTNNLYDGNFMKSTCGINANDVSDSMCHFIWGAKNYDYIPETCYEDENEKYEGSSEIIESQVDKSWDTIHTYY